MAYAMEIAQDMPWSLILDAYGRERARGILDFRSAKTLPGRYKMNLSPTEAVLAWFAIMTCVLACLGEIHRWLDKRRLARQRREWEMED